MHLSARRTAQGCVNPIGDVEWHAIGDATSATSHVRNRKDRVWRSDVELFGDLDGIVDFDAEAARPKSNIETLAIG